MDPGGNKERAGLEPSFQINVKALETFLKQHHEGEEVVKALRYRTMIHWLNPELDRLSSRMLPVYSALIGHLEWPFKFLDVGCMCGWLKHFIEQRFDKPFRYIGIDSWREALLVAKEFSPRIETHQMDILTEDIGTILENDELKFDYSWVSNIQFGKNSHKVMEKMMEHTSRAGFFGMPDYCGDYAQIAKELGFTNIQTVDCGEAHGSKQSLVIVKWQ
jgi:SAM-dependent methyltransferase